MLWLKICSLAVLLLVSHLVPVSGQVEAREQDSVRVMNPVNKRKVRKVKLSFRSFFRDGNEKADEGQKAYSKRAYTSVEGKIIRYIVIKTLDPFDYSMEGAQEDVLTKSSRFSNDFHVRSREQVIRNFVLFEEKQPYDSLLVKETERLIRKQSYTREVVVLIQPVPGQTDSLDLLIYVLDRWSIAGKLPLSKKRIAGSFVEKNLLGYGHELSGYLNRYHTDGALNASGVYHIPNISNTYINATGKLGSDDFKNLTKSIGFERPFFSPVTRWAGGFGLTQQSRTNPAYANDTLFELKTYRFNTQQFWVGFSFRIFKKGHPGAQITRLITAAGFERKVYLEKSTAAFDTLGIHADERFLAGSIGISNRKYVRDRLIYDSGITEDVPVGGLFALTGGYQLKNEIGRPYVGARIAFGRYFKWGYLSAGLGYGTYFRQGLTEQGAFSLELSGFSALIELGSWKYRQFVTSYSTYGLDRFTYEKLTLNDFYAPGVYNNSSLLGTKRTLLRLHSQFYTPYKLLGFRFSPFLIYALAIIGQGPDKILDNRAYSQFGLGVLVNNLNLVFNTIQLSIAYYPVMPDNGRHVFGLNPFNTAYSGFSSFEIGRPVTVPFK